MPVRRADVVAALSVHPPEPLRDILEAAGVGVGTAETSDQLADRVAFSLWWNFSTPLGFALGRVTLDDMVDHTAKRLRVRGMNESGDAWARLRSLTVTLARTTSSRIDTADPKGVSAADLDDASRARLSAAWLPGATAAMGGAASFGAGLAGKAVVRLGQTPVGRLLPLLPTVGPVWRGVRSAAGVAATVGTPLAVGLSAVALNETLGTNYHRFVPLLLGVGALGPSALEDAEEAR